MGYCSKCGNNLSDEDNFCSKCGARTKHGAESGVSTPMEDMRDAFEKMGQEMEKAFTIAAKEIHEAFRTAGENVRRTTGRESVTCSHCGQTNARDATYCYKCGEKISKK